MQTWAMLVDAYRELSARKLFWLGLLISGFVAACFSAVGLTPTGLQLLAWELQNPVLNSTVVQPGAFYKSIFLTYGVSFWLTWGTTILALVSTASIIPDFVSSGSIELMLSKPISRVRLFVIKYTIGLLFVAAQSVVFCGASFLVIGFRGGAWEPGLFLAIPFVVTIFSFLHCVCALVGLLTRSTLAAMIITATFWFAVFGLHATEAIILGWRLQRELEVESGQRRIESLATQLIERGAETEPTSDRQDNRDRAIVRLQEERERVERDLADLISVRDEARQWHRLAFAAKSILPKTSDTVELLRRILIRTADLPKDPEGDRDLRDGPFGRPRYPVSLREFADRHQQVMDNRPAWWILGTSLTFEAIILGIACWIFARRDF